LSKNELYENYVTNIYSNLNNFDEADYRQNAETLIRTYRRFLPANKDCRILDVGCGSGFFLYALRSIGYTDVRGIDLSPEQIDLAKGYGLNVECANFFDYLPNFDESFDLIICTDVMEHLTRDQLMEYMSLIRRALKPGGTFLAAVPNANAPFASRLRYKDLTHEQAFTEESIRQLFIIGDLTPEYVGDQTIPPSTIQAYARKGLSTAMRGIWRLFMIAELGKEAFGVPLDTILIAVGRKP
jgi:SAM-dependent methyltransferase